MHQENHIILCEKLSTPKDLHLAGVGAGKEERITNHGFY